MTRRIGTTLVLLAAALGAQQRTQAFSVPTATARFQEVNLSVQALATAAYDEATQTEVTARFAGWVEQVAVNTTYQPVQAGEVLCTVYSPDLYAAEQDYLFAVENRQTLAGSTVAGVARGADDLAQDARQRLVQMQAPAEEIARLERTRHAVSRFTIRAAAGGIVTQRLAVPGMQVAAGTRLYVLGALQPIWIYAEVPEPELGRVRVGEPAAVRLDAFPGRSFEARVEFINPQVDSGSRTGRVRLEMANRQGEIVPGMYGQATIEEALGRQLVIPAGAVVHSGTEDLAFVAAGQGQFLPRPLALGPQAGDDVVVRQGLRAGERVATQAAFLVASEAQLQAAAGSYAPPPPGVAAPTTAPSAAGQLQLTTAPTPAQKGDNTFRARLTTAAGAPITGAQLSLTLTMPAMPAMGMPALRVEVPLAETSGGFYEGKGKLPNGGNWQVQLIARKDGRVAAELHTSLRATGGM